MCDYKLNSPVISSAIITTLHLSIEKIQLIEKIKGWPEYEEEIKFQLINEKFSENSNYFKKYKNKSDDTINIEKFQKDCKTFRSILEITQKNLYENNSFKEFVDIIKNYLESVEEDKNLEKEYFENYKKLNELKCLLDQEGYDLYEKIQVITENIGKIKDGIVNFKDNSAIKICYIKDWLISKWEQSQITLLKKQENLDDLIRLKTVKIDQETRINFENTVFLNELIEDLEKQLEFWHKQYDTDLKKKLGEIQDVTEKRNYLFEKKQSLAKLYSQREQEINEYKAHKERIRLERLELERRQQSSIRIQAWWRGVMVRVGLGPFRKRNIKKGKKNSGGKKESGGKKGSAKAKK